MRWTRALTFPVLAVMLIACGGSATDDGNGGDGGNGSEETQAGEPDGGNDGGNDGNGGNGGDQGDLEQLANDLEPPNATESTRMSANEALIIAWSSTDSVDSLESYYDDKIGDLGLNLLGKSSAQGGHTWVIGNEDGSGPQGGVTVGEDGSGGTVISVTLGFQS